MIRSSILWLFCSCCCALVAARIRFLYGLPRPIFLSLFHLSDQFYLSHRLVSYVLFPFLCSSSSFGNVGKNLLPVLQVTPFTLSFFTLSPSALISCFPFIQFFCPSRSSRIHVGMLCTLCDPDANRHFRMTLMGRRSRWTSISGAGSLSGAQDPGILTSC